MVAAGKANARLLRKVAEVYGWLDSQIHKNSAFAGVCDACGKCCDFKGFDHRLFVTTPELIYFAAKLGTESIKAMTTNRGSTPSATLPSTALRTGKTGLLTTRCPYNVDGKCTVYKVRFAGCRIFCCKGDADFQSRLSEMAVKKFKSICEQYQIPYRYLDLAAALISAETK